MNKNDCDFHRAVIIGGNGAVGKLFAAHLTALGSEVTAIDLAPDPDADLRCTTYVACDARDPDSSVQQALNASQLVLVAVPETVAIKIVTEILTHVSPGALIVDTLSVKTTICEAVRTRSATAEYLSINPMFAPGAGFAGNNVAAIKVSPGHRTAVFLKLIEAWGCRVAELTAEQHDRLTATVQVATHAAILTFGLTLHRLGYNSKLASSLATPPHRAMLELLARIANGAPEVYWDIQSGNPHANEVRATMSESMNELSRIVEKDDFPGFRLRLEALLPLLEDWQK